MTNERKPEHVAVGMDYMKRIASMLGLKRVANMTVEFAPDTFVKATIKIVLNNEQAQKVMEIMEESVKDKKVELELETDTKPKFREFL